MSTILSTTVKVKNERIIREITQKPFENESWEKITKISRSYEVIAMPGRMTMIRREHLN
ncbi:hypothetical protein BH23BAC1_BH23BAC1_34040 [soil metagenome]